MANFIRSFACIWSLLWPIFVTTPLDCISGQCGMSCSFSVTAQLLVYDLLIAYFAVIFR